MKCEALTRLLFFLERLSRKNRAFPVEVKQVTGILCEALNAAVAFKAVLQGKINPIEK